MELNFFSKTFSAAINIIIWFVSFLVWCLILIDLHRLNHHPYIPEINSTTISWCVTFLYCWIQLAKTIFENFSSNFISEIGLKFSFSVISLSSLHIRIILASENLLGMILVQYFKRVLVVCLLWLFHRI